jgi:arylsulfatase A-like enzyme
MPSQPLNIVLIHSDQHRYDCLEHHGHPQLRTPNLGKLANQGVDFTHAFTPTPICSPARATLLTGRWPTQHRCINIPPFDGYQPAELCDPTLWELLHEHGYRQAHFGKFHKEVAGLPTDHGVDRYQWEEDDYDAWRKSQGLPLRVRRNGWFGEIDPDTTPEQTRIAWGANLTMEAIRDFADEGRPFFVRWDPSEPHLPSMIPQEIANDYPPETISPWPSFPDPLINKPLIQRQQRMTWGVDDWTWGRWAPVVSRYLAEITLMDQYIGQVVSMLDRAGMAENTLVIYSTDHGDLCGAHGMMDKHYMMYDDVIRVPLIMRLPGRLPAGVTCDAMVSHELDLATTLCHAAGITPPESFEGVNLLPIASGHQPGPRQDIYSQYFGCQFGLFSSRMVRDRRYKYVWNLTCRDELYDLQDDPAELANLIDEPHAADHLYRLRHRMIAWCESINDRQLNEFTRPQLEQPGVKLSLQRAMTAV